jgi:hypothetical protein
MRICSNTIINITNNIISYKTATSWGGGLRIHGTFRRIQKCRDLIHGLTAIETVLSFLSFKEDLMKSVVQPLKVGALVLVFAAYAPATTAGMAARAELVDIQFDQLRLSATKAQSQLERSHTHLHQSLFFFAC